MSQEDTSGVHLWLVLMKAHQALERHAVHSIQSTGLCFSDFTALEVLLHKGPQPVNFLSDKLNLTSGAITATVDRLEKKAYVERRFDAQDRRVRIVHLTESGETLIRGIFAKHEKDMETAVASLDRSERETLIQLMKKLGKDAAVLLSSK